MTTATTIPFALPEHVKHDGALGTVTAFGVTDAGLERDGNEDAFGYDDALGVFVVCDGMGGHAAGEVASALAVDTILDEFTKRSAVTPMDADDVEGAPTVVQQSAMRSAMRRAQNAIAQMQATRLECRGMGTTAAALKLTADEIVVAHVGDSRVYRFSKDDGLVRVTRDHSLYNRLLDDGAIDPAGVPEATFGQRNIIMRALGTQNHRAEIGVVPRRAGDVFVLCSDGLSDMISDARIEQIVAFYEGDPRSAARALVRAANEEGGEDNITALVVRLGDDPMAARSEKAGDDAEHGTNPRLAIGKSLGSTESAGSDGLLWMSLEEAILAS